MPFRVAISGLRAAQIDLNVIGNNVANANTTGFKQSRAEFADVYAASSSGISGQSPGGGVNLNRLAQQFSQGSISFTDNGLDLAISGQGFFLLDDNGTQVFSRAGAFGLDQNGFVVNAQGHRLITFSADAAGNITGATNPLQLQNANIPPQATDTMTLSINLDAADLPPVTAFNATDPLSFNDSTSTSIYDSLGNSHLATTYYRKTAANNWETYLYVDGADVGGPDTLAFSTAGALVTPVGGSITSPAFTPAGGGAAMTVTADYAGTTQFGAPFGVFALTQNGFTTGQLAGLDIDNQGIIFARFTNGQSQVQGQLALADFANQQGLQPVGDNNWTETFSSGPALQGAPGSASLGLIQAGALEESNTDLSAELVKMIIAQRNFQANAEVISTADAVTQSVINIR